MIIITFLPPSPNHKLRPNHATGGMWKALRNGPQTVNKWWSQTPRKTVHYPKIWACSKRYGFCKRTRIRKHSRRVWIRMKMSAWKLELLRLWLVIKTVIIALFARAVSKTLSFSENNLPIFPFEIGLSTFILVILTVSTMIMCFRIRRVKVIEERESAADILRPYSHHVSQPSQHSHHRHHHWSSAKPRWVPFLDICTFVHRKTGKYLTN